ncbi:MAG: serine/threonine protein kinase [Pyrinomonadaceae bacterium]|nr:serine/threonine protein kinase [Pyrinomonadaceae bacterium]
MNDQFIGKVIANKYRIESVLREGEFGKTYRGTHVSMEKPVIIKVLSPALAVDENIAWQFSSEAKTASHISHPNILNVTDFGSDVNGAVYIIFEDAEGATLKDEIQTVGQFASDRALEIAVQTASALSFAHSKGKFHGALTSEKILLTNSPNGAESVKILDFGAVKSHSGISLDEDANTGDVEYLAPEQCTDEGVGDERSDIYSLGVILYEMLAGEVPFKGEKPTDIMLKHSEEPPPPFSAFRQDLPADLEPVVLKALAKNPGMRYQTADEFAADLKNIQRGFRVSETAVAATPVSNNNIWKTAFVVLAGISLLAIGLIYATSVKSTDPTTALQTDANGQPVQPINPATGIQEQNYSNMSAIPAQYIGNSNSMPLPPGTMTDGGGDGYNPWANGVQPPPGAPVVPYAVPQGGQIITIDPNNPSQFMPNESGVILVPVPANTTVVNANVKPSPTPKTPNANANVSATPAPNSSPTPATPKPTPTPKTAVTPAAKPVEPPKTDNKKPPASTEKRSESGKSQDAF